MEFNLKQWRFQEQPLDESEAPAKLPRLFFDSRIKEEEEEEEKEEDKTDYSVSPQFHLFVPTQEENNNNNNNEQKITANLTTNSVSAYTSDHSTTRLRNKEEMGGSSYFSYGQWQELELQAVIYRHMLEGAAIPPQLLQMVHKSLFNPEYPASNSLSSSYYLHPLHPFSQYHPALLQSGYWGKGAMDPEPGRCRRTDGKKWRCTREVVGGQKYCERHVHRGRNRSRKPVEPSGTTTTGGTTANAASTLAALTGRSQSGPSSSIDHFHHAHRPSGPRAENFTSKIENKVNENLKSSGQPLRHFFDDWSNRSSDGSASSTSLSISTPGNTLSDFSLKLATGNENEGVERERAQPGWGGTGWGPGNQVAPMGGPLAEALRSSRGSNASPTSVLNLVK